MSLFVPIENLVEKKHPYRVIKDLVKFESVQGALDGCIKEVNSKYSIVQGFKMLLLQYMEDLSDRELERFLKENIAGKYLPNSEGFYTFCRIITSKISQH